MQVGCGEQSQAFPLYSSEALDLFGRALEYIQSCDQEEHSAVGLPQSVSPPTFFHTESNSEEDEIEDESGTESCASDASKETNSSNLVSPQTTCSTAKPSQNFEEYSSRLQSKKDYSQRHQRRKVPVKELCSRLNRIFLPVDDMSVLEVPLVLLRRQHQGLSLLSKCKAIHEMALHMGRMQERAPVIVLLLRSGRFAAGVFSGDECLHHTSSVRYTIRKGQGKAQSSQDGKRRAKSMGSQLRRAGEQSLKEDVLSTLNAWKTHFQRAALIFVSCPNTMKSTLFAPSLNTIFSRSDERVRDIPFDIGRPSFEAVCTAYEVLLTLHVGKVRPNIADAIKAEQIPDTEINLARKEVTKKNNKAEFQENIIPMAELHNSARKGDLTSLMAALSCQPSGSVNQAAGYDFMTPLHFAAESSSNIDPVTSAACISALLIHGHADPTKVDARLRPPYFLAVHDRTREAFRRARAVLGEDYCDWQKAKVGPPLTEEDIQLKKEKEAEKKRRKKAKQKEKRAREKAQAVEIKEQKNENEKRKEDVKGARLSLDERTNKGSNAVNICDFCGKECRGRKRLDMFTRLEYKYCSTDCVQKHKRELMANAAAARFR